MKRNELDPRLKGTQAGFSSRNLAAFNGEPQITAKSVSDNPVDPDSTLKILDTFQNMETRALQTGARGRHVGRRHRSQSFHS